MQYSIQIRGVCMFYSCIRGSLRAELFHTLVCDLLIVVVDSVHGSYQETYPQGDQRIGLYISWRQPCIHVCGYGC